MAGKVFKLILKVLIGLFLLSVGSVVVTKWVPVWYTPLMVRRAIQYGGDKDYHFHRTWTSLEDIGPNMVKTVIASEDNLFYVHNGFDWKELRKEIDKSKKRGKHPRGCSTISQQTAKNVFTLGDHSFFRKGVEAYFTFLIEKIWGKKRIMEVYLNVAEMGKGVYGIGAAAKYWYGVKPSRLSLQQCALITACFPNPVKRSPLRMTAYMGRRSAQIVSLCGKIDYRFIREDWKLGRK